MEFTRSGDPELDLILGGGLGKGSTIILAGAPGAGKTILAQQMCFAAAARGEKAIYFTTHSESHSKLIRHLESFDFFDHAAVGPNGVEFIHLSSIMTRGEETDVSAAMEEVARKTFKVRPAIVVIDSFTPLFESTQNGSREIIYELINRIAQSGAVLIFIGEFEPYQFSQRAEFSLADGIVHLAQEAVGRMDRRTLRVVKMRGAPHVSGTHSVRIQSSGIHVFPRLESTTETGPPPVQGRLATGTPGLDALMDGGIPNGDTCLIVGPSGIGKTMIAMRYVSEGIARGERCVYVSLQESVEEILAKSASFGWDFAGAKSSGTLKIVELAPTELSLDIVALELRDAMRLEPVHRVVIDSLAELRHAAQGTERFPAYFWVFARLLRTRGASAMITSDTTSVFGPTEELLSGLSFVFQDTILLRYVEIEGKVRRAITVLKMRNSKHEKGLHELVIDERGPQISDELTGLTAILGSSPTAGGP